MSSSLEDVGKSPGGDSIVSFLRVTHNDDGTLKVVPTGSNSYAVRAINATGSATTSDNLILADATTAGVTVNLPSAASLAGQQLIIRKTDTTNNHAVTITPNGTETINGNTGNYVLRKPRASVSLISDGSNWQVMGAPLVPRGESGTATVYYVSANNGNDANSGRSAEDAFKTIGAAITAAPSGSTIYVAPGTYAETIDPGAKSNFALISTVPLGAVVQAPTTSASALQFSVTQGPFYIKGFQFQGGVGSGSTYTGIVCNMANFTIGSVMEDCTIYGINTDFTGSKTAIGKGVYGGTGMSFDGAEQASYRNISLNNCHIAMAFPATGTLSKNLFEHFHIGQCFIVHQETNGGAAQGDNTFRNFKTQNVFGLTYAIAQLNSNGNNPADGDTVVVRNQTYRFKTTMAQANDVQIGATIDATLLSLVKAVNGTGVVGTDYFTGTAQPTGVQAGWMNLVDYGASGGNGFTLGAVDATRHACTFQVTDVLGPAGNAYTFTVTSANLSDYLGKGTFDRAAWAIELYKTNQWLEIDAMENISLPIGNAILIGASACMFEDFVSAPQTQVSITGSANYFVTPKMQNNVIIQAGAVANVFDFPFPNTGVVTPSSSRIQDNGTGTVIRLSGRSGRAPLTVTYSASMTPRTDQGEDFVITATNGTAFTINAPSPGGSSSLFPGMTITYTIRNTSGGALGAATWNAVHKMAAWTQPATGFSRSITFRYDGTNWIEISRTPSDVPN